MHPVAIYHLRYNLAQNDKGPRYVGINRLSWDRKPMKALPRVVTTPNATTLYGFGALDLSKEPVVITVPEIKDRYWSIQLYDNYARWWHLIGSQYNAPGPVRRLVIGPNWSGKLPAGFVGADIVQSSSDFAGVVALVPVLWYEHHVVRPNDLSRAELASFLANGVFSIAFFLFAAADVVFTGSRMHI